MSRVNRTAISIILLLALLIIQLPISHAESASEEEFDFRKSKWGATKEEVQLSESAELIMEIDNALAYETKILTLSMLTVYYFDKAGRLYVAAYSSQETHSNDYLYYSDYESLVSAYTEKYGKPFGSQDKWSNNRYKNDKSEWGFAASMGYVTFTTEWKTKTTQIDVALKGDNYKCSLIVVYKPLDYEFEKDTDGI